MSDRLLTLREVADELGVHVETVRRRIRSGKLAVVNLGSSTHPLYRVRGSELEKFIEASDRNSAQQ